MKYTIVKKHLSCNHNEGVYIKPKGGVLHSTASPGATDENEFKYFDRGADGRQASATTFIDWDSITEFVFTKPGAVERTWHAGKTANDNYFGAELCEPKGYDAAKFKEVWDRAVWYFAYALITYAKVTKVTKTTLMSHAEVSAKWGETDHQDPVAYFKRYGKTVDEFRVAVQSKINEMKK